MDKNSGKPDNGYDIKIYHNDKIIKCSVKSTLLSEYDNKESLHEKFNMLITDKEIVDVNIQVFFWLDIDSKTKSKSISEYNMTIVGWHDEQQLLDADYLIEKNTRPHPTNLHLADMHPMAELAEHLDNIPNKLNLGICPNCKSEVIEKNGEYKCKNNCGLNLMRVSGINLSQGQVKRLLNGKNCYAKQDGRQLCIFPKVHTYNDDNDVLRFSWETKLLDYFAI